MNMYNKTVLHYFEHTPHAGQIHYGTEHTAMLGDPAQGMVFALALQIADQQIKQATFQAYGSTVLIACGEYLCQCIENKTITDFNIPTAEQMRQVLGLPRSVISAMILVEETLKRILNPWENKNGK